MNDELPHYGRRLIARTIGSVPQPAADGRAVALVGRGGVHRLVINTEVAGFRWYTYGPVEGTGLVEDGYPVYERALIGIGHPFRQGPAPVPDPKKWPGRGWVFTVVKPAEQPAGRGLPARAWWS